MYNSYNSEWKLVALDSENQPVWLSPNLGSSSYNNPDWFLWVINRSDTSIFWGIGSNVRSNDYIWYCNVSFQSDPYQSIKNCNGSWFFGNISQGWSLDTNARVMTNICPVLGDDLCVHNSKLGDINNDFVTLASIPSTFSSYKAYRISNQLILLQYVVSIRSWAILSSAFGK